jgi:hypothetical protein
LQWQISGSKMKSCEVNFSIASDAAWAPGVETREAWHAWAKDVFRIAEKREPAVAAMPAMLRRRAGFHAKMALEVAYACLGERRDVATVFCSRHGEVHRSVDMLSDLARGELLSPTAFGLSVHNAAAGLFSIARADKANSSALSAGQSGVEHGVIEACGLLADGEPEVLLVVSDCPLPSVYADFQDEDEQPYAWAWLLKSPGDEPITLAWSAAESDSSSGALPAGLEVLRFHLRKDEKSLTRTCGARRWQWMRGHA